jgi:hypothetical protein
LTPSPFLPSLQSIAEAIPTIPHAETMNESDPFSLLRTG